MKIKLWAALADGVLTASVSGDVLTINGEIFDFTKLYNGMRLPGHAIGSAYFLETDYVERIDGVINVTVRLPVHWDSPEAVRNPETPIVIDVVDGPVMFPDTTPVVEEIPEVEEVAND